jgi:hypothetical protein
VMRNVGTWSSVPTFRVSASQRVYRMSGLVHNPRRFVLTGFPRPGADA